jgi:23S rRNA (uracil1939-C5)-methyltransferase
MDGTLQVGDLVDVEIEKLVYGGDGFARVDGRALFVPLAAPGERVRVRVTHVERTLARAVVEEVLEASRDRRSAPCEHFGVCGGCQLQHLDYRAQLTVKAELVREALRRIGKLEWTRDIEVKHAAELGYRSRAELQIARDGRLATGLGYFRAGSHQVCDVRACPILAPELDRERAALRSRLAHIAPRAACVHLAIGDGEPVALPVDAREHPLADVATLSRRVAGFDLRFDALSFFQGNRSLVHELVEAVLGAHRGEIAVDLYAGVGLFALPLARRFRAVLAVEESERAARWCAENAHSNGVANAMCAASSVERWLEHEAKPRSKPDLVVLDPPRSGAGVRVVDGILALEPAAVAYVSCDPTTLARDLRTFLDRGWSIDSIVALDMFPQTYHVETVVQLSRSARVD